MAKIYAVSSCFACQKELKTEQRHLYDNCRLENITQIEVKFISEDSAGKDYNKSVNEITCLDCGQKMKDYLFQLREEHK